MKQAVAGIASNATSEYIRASCAYCARNGLKAIRTAANQAAFVVPQIARPAQNAGRDRQQREQQAEPAHARLAAAPTSSQKCSSM